MDPKRSDSPRKLLPSPYQPFATQPVYSSFPTGSSRAHVEAVSRGQSTYSRLTPVVVPPSCSPPVVLHSPVIPALINHPFIPSYGQIVPDSPISPLTARSSFFDDLRRTSSTQQPLPFLDRGSEESKGSKESRRGLAARDMSSSLSDFSKQMVSLAPSREDDDMSFDMRLVSEVYSKLFEGEEEDADEADLADENNFEIQDRLVPSGSAANEQQEEEEEEEQPKQEQKKRRKKKKKKKRFGKQPLAEDAAADEHDFAPGSNWIEAEPFVPAFLKGRQEVSYPQQPPESRVRSRRAQSNFSVISNSTTRSGDCRIADDQVSVASDSRFSFNKYATCKLFFLGVCRRGNRCRLLHVYEKDRQTTESGRLLCRSRYVDALCRLKTIVLPSFEEMKDSIAELASQANGCLLLRLWLRNASKDDCRTVCSRIFGQIPVMMRNDIAHRVIMMLLPQLDQAQLAEIVNAISPTFGATCCCEYGSTCVVKLFDVLRDTETISFFVLTVSTQAETLANSAYGCAVLIHVLSHCKQSLLNPLYEALSTDVVLQALLKQDLCPCALCSALDKASKAQRSAIVSVLARHASEIMATPHAIQVIRFVTDNIRDPGVGAIAAKSLESMIPSLLLDEATVFIAEKLVMSYDREAQRIFVHALMKEKDLVPAMLESIPASRVLQAALVNVTARQYIHLVTLLVKFKPLLESTEGGRIVSSKMTRAVTDGNEVFQPERAATEKSSVKTRSPEKTSASSLTDQSSRRSHHQHRQQDPNLSQLESSSISSSSQHSSPRKHPPRSRAMASPVSDLGPPPSPPKTHRQQQRNQR